MILFFVVRRDMSAAYKIRSTIGNSHLKWILREYGEADIKSDYLAFSATLHPF